MRVGQSIDVWEGGRALGISLFVLLRLFDLFERRPLQDHTSTTSYERLSAVHAIMTMEKSPPSESQRAGMQPRELLIRIRVPNSHLVGILDLRDASTT